MKRGKMPPFLVQITDYLVVGLEEFLKNGRVSSKRIRNLFQRQSQEVN
jgi:hypothetical protein